jgi:hypothetical protein
MKKKLLALMLMGMMLLTTAAPAFALGGSGGGDQGSGLTRHEKVTSVCIARGRRPGHRGTSAATSATHTDPTPAHLSL